MVFEEFVDFGAEGSLEGGKVFADGGFEVVILVEFSLQKVFVDLNEGEGRYAWAENQDKNGAPVFFDKLDFKVIGKCFNYK